MEDLLSLQAQTPLLCSAHYPNTQSALSACRTARITASWMHVCSVFSASANLTRTSRTNYKRRSHTHPKNSHVILWPTPKSSKRSSNASRARMSMLLISRSSQRRPLTLQTSTTVRNSCDLCYLNCKTNSICPCQKKSLQNSLILLRLTSFTSNLTFLL